MNRSPMLVTTAGVLVLVAVAGSLTFDRFWWSLMPAAGLLAAGLFGAFQTLSPPMPRFVGLGLGAAALVALLGSIAGWVAVNRIGVEPDWVGSLATGTATAVIVAAATLGIGLVAEGRGSRLTGFLLATALPIGLGIDWGLDMLFPPGHPDIFLLGAGYYLGMALFGIALIRLGRFLIPLTGGFAQGRRRFRRAAPVRLSQTSR